MAEVRLEVELAHPLERVWRAFTDAHLLTEWFMPTDLEPYEGSQFTLDPGNLDGFLGTVSGEVTELAARQRVVMLWQGEQLHTRVVWELAATADGCQVRMVQSGFIGAPATLRRRALRATYTRLFTEHLPGVLERLSADAPDPAADLPDPASQREFPVRAAVPQQRAAPAPEHRVRGVAVAAFPVESPPAGTPPLDDPPGDPPLDDPLLDDPPAPVPPPASPVTYVRSVDVPSPRGVAGAPDGPVSGPADGTADGMVGGPADGPADPEGGTVPARTARWRQRLAGVPAWGRALAIGTAAAVFAVAVLAGLSQTTVSPPAGGDQPAGQGDVRDGPGMAVQPQAEESHSSPADPPRASPGGTPGTAASSTGDGGEPAPGTETAPTGPDGGSNTTPDGPGSTPTESTTGPVAPAPPELAAQLTTSSRLLGLSGITVSVTVSNPGPGDASGWEVTMDVGDQDVTSVSGGVTSERDGSRLTFTPTGGGPAEGEQVELSFDIPGSGLLGLGGADAPTDCQIDGRSCG